jgi:hypothetical protein
MACLLHGDEYPVMVEIFIYRKVPSVPSDLRALLPPKTWGQNRLRMPGAEGNTCNAALWRQLPILVTDIIVHVVRALPRTTARLAERVSPLSQRISQADFGNDYFGAEVDATPLEPPSP